MNLLSELRPLKGSRHRRRRIGRGPASGWGGTSGKGHKGQKVRSGAPIRRGFEGGQTPLQVRLPKFGFTNRRFKKEYEIINLDQLSKLEEPEVTPEILKKRGLVSRGLAVKILGRGECHQALNIKAHKVSQSARQSIEAAGGKVEIIKVEKVEVISGDS